MNVLPSILFCLLFCSYGFVAMGQMQNEMTKMNVEIAQKSYKKGEKTFALKVLQTTQGHNNDSEILSMIGLIQYELKKYEAAKITVERYFEISDINSLSYVKMVGIKKSLTDIDKFNGGTEKDLIFQKTTKNSVEDAVNSIMSSFKPVCKSIIGSN